MKILENNDGAILQIIYAGSRQSDVNIVGIIEGQSNPREIETLDHKDLSNHFKKVFLIFISIFSLGCAINLSSFLKNGWRKSGIYLYGTIFIMIITFFSISLFVIFLLIKRWSVPPIEFMN